MRPCSTTALAGALCCLWLMMAAEPAAADPAADFSGLWTITASLTEGSVAASLELTRSADGYVGHSGALDTFRTSPLDYRGSMQGEQLHLTALSNGREVGALDVSLRGSVLTGGGALFGTQVRVTAQHPTPILRTPRTFDYDPVQFHPLTSSAPAPVLRLVSGDTVRTRTVDAYGVDEAGAQASMPGNPGTGPFYVDGALPGDTVAIHILRLRTNRSTARMGNGGLEPKALTPGYLQSAGAITDPVWLLNPAQGTATLRTASERLKNFAIPLQPMLGVVSVAFPGGLSTPNADLGEWGGNLDYPAVREGATLYLPVYQAGALIYLGDGHARQGDGEVTGQGLETSMAVEFQVTLIKGQTLSQPWAENADYVMVSGIGGSLDSAMQRATAGLARWIKRTYGLDDSEVAAVLGSSLQYDIAEVVDPKLHVVAKVRKDILAQIIPAATAAPR